MVSLRFFALVLVAGAALAFLSFSAGVLNSAVSGSDFTDQGVIAVVPAAQDGRVMTVINNRKLKDDNYIISPLRSTRNLAGINMADYPCFDPVPTSKATITSGPIEHGTPLMPYVPRPTPPVHHKHRSP